MTSAIHGPITWTGSLLTFLTLPRLRKIPSSTCSTRYNPFSTNSVSTWGSTSHGIRVPPGTRGLDHFLCRISLRPPRQRRNAVHRSGQSGRPRGWSQSFSLVGPTLELWGGTILQWLVPFLLAAYFFAHRQTTGFVFLAALFLRKLAHTGHLHGRHAGAGAAYSSRTGDPEFAEHDFFRIFSDLSIPTSTRKSPPWFGCSAGAA